MLFKELCKYLDEIEKEPSRLIKEKIISQIIDLSNNVECSIIGYIITDRLSPMFVPIEFNMSVKSIIKTLIKIFPNQDVNEKYKNIGDLGNIYEQIDDKTTSDLSIEDIYSKLWEIALVSGNKSVENKSKLLENLLDMVSSTEGKYIIRIIIGKMRLGCSERTILFSLSKKYNISQNELDYYYGIDPDIGHIMYVIKNGQENALKDLRPTPSCPFAVQLVQRSKTVSELYDRYKEVIVQPKYDGLRCQIHILDESEKRLEDRIWQKYLLKGKNLFNSNNRVKLFTRSQEEITDMFPEICKILSESNIKSGIFDSEVIGVDNNDDTFIKFQETIKRKRKYLIEDKVSEIPIKAYIFDVLFLNDRVLMNEKLLERLNVLTQIENLHLEKIVISKSHFCKSVKEINDTYNIYINKGLEGIIAKNPNSKYQPGLRNFEWIKLKKSANKNFVDTLDVVILGYYKGTGKRATFGVGAVLMGIYDSENGVFKTITKVGTGITEDLLIKIKIECDKKQIKEIPPNVIMNKDLFPDVLVEPTIVCVIEGDEISISDKHTSGYSLRFPRLIQFNRFDKKPNQITSLEEIKQVL